MRAPAALIALLVGGCGAGPHQPHQLPPRGRLSVPRSLLGQEQRESLLDRLRDLMVLAACGRDTELVDLSDEARAQEFERSERFDAAGLVHMIALCESVQRSIKSSSAPRALFDAAIVRLALTEKLADVTAVVAAASGGPALKAGGRSTAKKA